MRVNILATSFVTLAILLLAVPSRVDATRLADEPSYAAGEHLQLAGYSSAQWRYERKVDGADSPARVADPAVAVRATSSPWYARRLERVGRPSSTAFELETTSTTARTGSGAAGGCTVLRTGLERPWC